jgi:hypothetical protein
VDPLQEHLQMNRRRFLATAASGLGGLALTSMMASDVEASIRSGGGAINPLLAKPPHFQPKAKCCIFIMMAGAPSQLDLFDYKPKLNELDGQSMPDSLLENARFAFLQKESAVLLGTKRRFKQHGKSGMWFSDKLPHIARHADDICMMKTLHTDQFNHHPGQLMMQCGVGHFGQPTMGSWMSYGLGTENDNLPAYVVLTAGRGASGGSTLWQSGFLPSMHAGVRFRNKGAPILDLNNPNGLPDELQRAGLDALRDINTSRHAFVGDPEIESRISSYELAYRMQSSAPELMDLSGESQATKELYGMGRTTPKSPSGGRGGGNDTYDTFAKNCLLARRMAERGVRFINIVHASWDHHNDLDPGLSFNAGMADQPIAALIQDLKQRGMLDDTLVVWGSEFGRTPLGENRKGSSKVTGRDHHPNCFSMFMAGGGTKGGLSYGETDEIGWDIVKDPIHVNDFQATLLHLFGMDHEKLTYNYGGLDRRLTQVTRESHVITDLLA